MDKFIGALALHRQRELISEAAQAHRANQVTAAQPHAPRHETALAWLGERFIAWGWRLRVRYGKVEHTLAPVSGTVR